MAGWHHQLDELEFEWTLGDGDGQGGLVCCDSWGRKELDMTERLNWTELTVKADHLSSCPLGQSWESNDERHLGDLPTGRAYISSQKRSLSVLGQTTFPVLRVEEERRRERERKTNHQYSTGHSLLYCFTITQRPLCNWTGSYGVFPEHDSPAPCLLLPLVCRNTIQKST